MVKFLLYLVILLSSFLPLWGSKIMAKDYPVDQRVVNPLMGKAAKYFEHKYHMNPIGIGISMPNGIVKRLGIEFQVQKPLSKQEAREILIACANELLSMINNNKEIRPYLRNFPFTLKNVGIGIFIANQDGSDVYHPDICVASISNGELTYDTRDKNNRYSYKSTTTESYEEALKALSVEEGNHFSEKRPI